MKSAILRPDGWFFHEQSDAETLGFFVTREPLTTEGSFRTGFTINVLRNVQAKSGLKPSAFVNSFADKASREHELTNRGDKTIGPMTQVNFRYVDAPPGKQSITIHNSLIGNERTGSVFLFMFEAPTYAWDATWRTAEVVMQHLMVDDEV